MPLNNLILISLLRKNGVALNNFFSKSGPEVQATLRHSWQNGKKDRGPSMESRIKGFEYRKFPMSGKWNYTQFCKITTGHGNSIEDLANRIVFLLLRNSFLYMPKHGLFFFPKEIVQWKNGIDLPGFDHMITLSVWIWDFVTEVHWVKLHHRIYGSFFTQISRYLVSKSRFSLEMGTVCTVCPI